MIQYLKIVLGELLLSDIEVLKAIEKCCGHSNRCNASQLEDIFKNIDTLTYLQSLKSNEYISVYLGGNIVLQQKGIDLLKKVKKEKFKQLLKIIQSVTKWLLGILASIIAAYFIFKLGLN